MTPRNETLRTRLYLYAAMAEFAAVCRHHRIRRHFWRLVSNRAWGAMCRPEKIRADRIHAERLRADRIHAERLRIG